MNLSSAYLTILAFLTYPRLVRANEWMRLALLPDDLVEEQSSSPFISFFDPFYESVSLSSMIRRQQQVLEDFENNFFRGDGHMGLMSPATSSSSIFHPPQPQPSYYNIQVSNDPNHFEVSISQLPSGLSPEDLKVDFDERTRQLTISGQYEFTNEETSYRSVSSFSRSFALDPFVEVDQLKATINTDNGGVLTVTAPKKNSEHSHRTIPVMMMNEQQPQKVVLEIKSGDDDDEEEEQLPPPPKEEPSEVPPPPEVIRSKHNEVEETEEGETYNDSFDPFHIKERVQKTLFRQNQQNNNSINNNNILDDTTSGFKTSELRRRRRN